MHGDEVLAILPSRSDTLTLYNVTSELSASVFLHFHSKAGACANLSPFSSLFQLLVLEEVAGRISLDDYKVICSHNDLLTDHFSLMTFATNTHAAHELHAG